MTFFRIMEETSINRRKRNSLIVGTALMVVVILVLLASPTFLFSPTATFIDTELNKASENRIPVRTKTDFGRPEVMASFPKQIGKWEGTDHDVTEYVELLGANLVLLRNYLPSTFTQPLFFTIVQAKTVSSFHPPKVCFAGQGYQTQEEGDETVDMTDTSWLKGSTPVSVPFKKMVVTKASKNGQISERRVALYCYVKGNQFYSDTITMIQTEALAPLQGSYEGALSEQKDFLVQSVPLMFSPDRTEGQWLPLAVILVGSGVGGMVLLVLLLLAPLAIIMYPYFRRKSPEVS
jgi:hypothetical protein